MSKHGPRLEGNSPRSEHGDVVPDAVCHGLVRAHGDKAGAEALLRAFLAERNGDRAAARFWIAAYGRLTSAISQQA